MSSELQIYKRNRTNELTSAFNSNVARLNSSLVINIRNIQRSRLRNKTAVINSLISQYNNNVNALRNNLNSNIQKINSFIP